MWWLESRIKCSAHAVRYTITVAAVLNTVTMQCSVYHRYNLFGIPHRTFLLFKLCTLPVQITPSSISVDENHSIRAQRRPNSTFQTFRRILVSFKCLQLETRCWQNTVGRRSRTFLVHIIFFIRFARISYGRFIAMRYKCNLSTYVQELLLIGGAVYRERYKRGNG